MFPNSTREHQKEQCGQPTFRAFLVIMEEVSHLPLQSNEPTEALPLLPLTLVGQKLTEIIRQALPCHSVACHLIDPQTSQFHLVGISGLMAGQVITNYLVNVLRYSAQERPIEVMLELIEEENMARVTVRDQGVGIAPVEMSCNRAVQDNEEGDRTGPTASGACLPGRSTAGAGHQRHDRRCAYPDTDTNAAYETV